MHTKYSLLFILLFVIQNISFSQETAAIEEENNITHEIGINATSFITNFLKFNDISNNNNIFSGYDFKYRKINNTTKFIYTLRGNLGFRNNSTGNGIDGVEPTTNTNFTISMINGFGKNIADFKKWNLSWSFDLLTTYRLSYSQFTGLENNKFNNTRLTAGMGPSLNILFRINSHMSLSTEAAFYTLYSLNQQTSEFIDFNGDLIKNETSSHLIDANVNLPLNIWFNYNF